ncbi:unnamed protein product [Musa acuminata subsp. malaccensis]|uniref:(wild Malaysian banana) hypothetical protein n=1 Tax=Musa acuminata subsp. malaccensis TaxID=214687 RepID=A0A804K056_MUSAM|nr:PREDICTED: zinc finger CCCH domain-containing protein 2-like [Musa acuminata subsp. malaccensis]CAG1857841.1 unnamed protein product [Musa acuminata subsp. malaccensis]
MVPGQGTYAGPTAYVAPWSYSDNSMAAIQHYPVLPVSGVAGLSADLPPHLLGEVGFAAFQRFLPRNDGSSSSAADPTAADAYACDEFRMYEFKVRRCPRGRSHDWTECPYAHPGEKARRRDPRRFHYSGSLCPDFRRGGGCRRGESCDLAHGVFETWLHPARYRTQPCKDGAACRRRVCFFAHSPEQLRLVLPPSPISPSEGGARVSSSPTSTLALAPMSPPSDGSSPPVSPVALDEVIQSMSNLQLSKVRSRPPFGTRSGAAVLGRAPLAAEVAVGDAWEAAAAAAAWGSRSKLLEWWKRQEEEEEAAEAVPDLGWVTELVND